jgi:hypothetical protein
VPDRRATFDVLFPFTTANKKLTLDLEIHAEPGIPTATES